MDKQVKILASALSQTAALVVGATETELNTPETKMALPPEVLICFVSSGLTGVNKIENSINFTWLYMVIKDAHSFDVQVAPEPPDGLAFW